MNSETGTMVICSYCGHKEHTSFVLCSKCGKDLYNQDNDDIN